MGSNRNGSKDHASTETISVFLETTDPFPKVADVGANNIQVMHWIVRHLLKLTPGTDNLYKGLPNEWREEVLTEAMPLHIYGVVERNLARLLGDPSKLMNVAKMAAARMGFGENLMIFRIMAVIAWLILPLLTSPAFLFQFVIATASRLYNRNKDTQPVRVTWRSAVMRTTRAKMAGLVLRDIRHDIFSVLWWAPGFTASAVQFWYSRGVRGIRHLLVELDPADVVSACAEFLANKELPDEQDEVLNYNGQVIAHKVMLYREGNTPYFTVERPNGNDRRVGWKVIHDVIVKHSDGHEWTIFREGEIYSAEAGCCLTEYDFTPPRLLIPFGLWWWLFNQPLAILLTPLVKLIQWIMSSTASSATLKWLLEEREADAKMRELTWRELFPDRHTAALATSGQLVSEEIEEAVFVFFDFVGHTARRAKVGFDASERATDEFWSLLVDFDADVRIVRGELPTRLVFGDIVVRLVGYAGDAAVVAVYNAPKSELLRVGLKLASYLHDAAETTGVGSLPPLTLRIAVTSGDMRIRRIGRRISPGSNDRMLMRETARSLAIDRASRILAVGKQLQYALKSKTGQEAERLTILERDLMRAYEGLDQFERLGYQDLREFGARELVRFLDDKSGTVRWPESVLGGKKK